MKTVVLKTAVPLAAVILAAVTLWSCQGDTESPSTTDPQPAASSVEEDLQAAPFVEVSEQTGLMFTHFNGMSGELYFSEMMGPGAAFLDFDSDGDLDVFLPQGQALDALAAVATAPGDRLFRNDLVADLGANPDAGSEGALRFIDITAQSGLAAAGYSYGAAVGDYDGDGWPDLYVTRFGPNQLWRNRGDGTFEDVTAISGTADDRWSTSAVFVDIDIDGRLDLFVANYVDFTLATHKSCRSRSGRPDYCGPTSYDPVVDRLLRNRGDGTFAEITLAAGMARPGNGLGVVSADFDSDGWPDLYVANDQMANFLWRNRGDGTFEDVALLAGVAVNFLGESEASMGLDADDFDNDGDVDLFLTHLEGETNTLYRNDGRGVFEDHTAASGLGPPSLAATGFGTAFLDYDNDGRLDLLVVNGAVVHQEGLARAGDPFPLHQRNQLFHQQRDGTFLEVGGPASWPLALSEVSRGAAFGDIDNDGDVDVLVANNNGRARLLLNQVGQDHHWIGLRLVAGQPPRDQPGALVTVLRGGEARLRVASRDGSYASSSDPRGLVGLADDGAPVEVRVRWPGGGIESWPELEVDRYHVLAAGSGRPGEPEGR